ncbi:MAG TPA: dihydrofolate reductase [Methylomirabilota bacterium]|nr:dihydrofolate reductase [Methylomirabilota bacterium]
MNKPRISIIVAMDENYGIGRNNDLLFRIPEDFNRMQQLTTGHPIIMGRKTFESIGRVLPKRTNIIVTRDTSFKIDGAIVVASLEEGLEVAKSVILSESKDLKHKKDSITTSQNDNTGEIFIFGGGQLFTEAIEKGLVDRLYLTIVKGDYDADTFFPDYSMFTKVLKKEEHEEDGYQYAFLDLEK